MKSAKNDHYISRFLTKPWEIEGRKLRYIDLGLQTVKTASSKRLFAEFGLNDPTTEKQLARLVENPVAANRDAIALGKLADDLPWDVRRAMVLLVFLQATRVY